MMKTLQECIIDSIRKMAIYEMAKNQSDCENTVRIECKNITINLFLLNYFRISGLHTTNTNHWKQELIVSITNAWDFKVRKDKSISRRERIVNRVFNEEDMMDEQVIAQRVMPKLDIEKETQYETNPHAERWFGEAVVSVINQMNDVKEFIINRQYNSLKKWVNNIL